MALPIDGWDDLFAMRDRPVHVVGAASVEGAHLLLFLLDHGFTNLTGHDFSTPDEFARAFKRVHVGWPMTEREAMLARVRGEVRLRYRDAYLDGIAHAEAIGVTQAWYLYAANRPLQESAELQARFFSLVELYLALSPGPVVGVSGSHGKSTTTRLLQEMLRHAGREVIAAGNDRHGRQALDQLERAGASTCLVLEISNRHLLRLRRSPQVAVLTNVYPNHLDEHGGWDGYVEAKSRMVRFQRPDDIAVLNADLDVTRGMRGLTAARVVWFGEGRGAGDGVLVDAGAIRSYGALPALTLARDAISVPGEHNALNVAAAVAAALAMGVDEAAIERAVRAFRGLKHRIQFVWNAAGVRFYDDLNSTTPTATEAALRTLGGAVVWILGGDDKGLDSRALAETARSVVKTALALPGAGTERIVRDLAAAGVAVERMETFPGAVRRAVALATDGDAVLLSPACPGFFTRYYLGGDEDSGFKKLVRQTTLAGRAEAQAGPSAEPPSPPSPGGSSPTSPPARKPRRSADPR